MDTIENSQKQTGRDNNKQTASKDNGGDTPLTKSKNAEIEIGQLRLSQDFAAEIGVQKTLVSVPVRKPDRQWFIRVHPDPDWEFRTAVFLEGDRKEAYLVDRGLWDELAGEIVPQVLYTAVDRFRNVFLWPIRLPGEDGHLDQWNLSALEAAKAAKSAWIRVASNRTAGLYDVYTATGDLGDPVWPDIGFNELVRIAFRDRFIDSLAHPVLRQLRGEI